MFLETRGPAQTLPGRAESGREDEERPWPPIPATLTKPQQTRAAFSLKKKGRDRGGAQRVPPRPRGPPLRFTRLDFK